MQLIFTEYIERLSPAGDPPSRESFARVWGELRRLLELELRRRSLWDAPPSYLGVYGRPRWVEAPITADRGPGREDGLEELVADLYQYVFIDRLGALVAQLPKKPSIEGLVLRNLRNFLYELQKKFDPLGFRIFQLFHEAVTRAVDTGELFLLTGDPKIRNETVLGSRPEADPEQISTVPEEIFEAWNEVLLPELVVGKGKAREWVIDTLQALLRRLPSEGVDAFKFRDLLAPLKTQARAHWALRLASTQGEMGVVGDPAEEPKSRIVPITLPNPEVEDRESFEKLDRCLVASLEDLAPDQPREDLRALWRTLRQRAQDGEIPSKRKLAEEMEFNRRRLSKLFTTLGELVDGCQRTLLGAGSGPKFGGGAQGAEGGAMNMKERAEQLRLRTGEARRRLEEEDHSAQERSKVVSFPEETGERREETPHRPGETPQQGPRAPRRRLATYLVTHSSTLAAAVLLAVSLALTGGLFWQRQEILRLEHQNATGAPQSATNIPFATIFFSTDAGRNDTVRLVLPADTSEVFLLLNVYEFRDEPFTRYRLRIRNRAADREIWATDELVEMQTSNLTVQLPTTALPQGPYLFELYGLDGGRESSLAVSSLEIEYGHED